MLYKIVRKVTTSPIPPRHAHFPFFDSHQFWRMGSGGGCNQTCHILPKSVQGLCP